MGSMTMQFYPLIIFYLMISFSHLLALIYHLTNTPVTAVHSTEKYCSNLFSSLRLSWVLLFHPAVEHYFPLEFLWSPLHSKSPAYFFAGSLPQLRYAYSLFYRPTLLLETALDFLCTSAYIVTLKSSKYLNPPEDFPFTSFCP